MDALPIEPGIFPAPAYNQIETFEEFHYRPSPEILREAAQIFVKHGMHLDYGLCLRHRHVQIPNGTVMIHSPKDGVRITCEPERVASLDPTTIYPHSLFLNANAKLQAYEYITCPPKSTLSLNFLRDLIHFIDAHNLRDSVALSVIPSEPTNSILDEYLLGNGKGMTYLPRDPEKMLKDNDTMTTTAWSFNERDDGSFASTPRRGCDPKGGGRHENKPDK